MGDQDDLFHWTFFTFTIISWAFSSQTSQMIESNKKKVEYMETIRYFQVAGDVGAGQNARGGREEDGEDGEEVVHHALLRLVVGHHVGHHDVLCASKSIRKEKQRKEKQTERRETHCRSL